MHGGPVTDEVVIRPIVAADVDGFHACVGAVARERRWLAMVDAPPLENMRRFVETTIARGWPQVVAVHARDVVGWCDVSQSHRVGSEHSGGLGMGLLPAHRGHGLGARLLANALDRSWAFGFTRVELEVYASNVAAIRLYERAGFEREGLKRRARFLDGTWDDMLVMAIVRE